jgi:hypothetical protein
LIFWGRSDLKIDHAGCIPTSVTARKPTPVASVKRPMPSLSDGSIRTALKRVEKSRKQEMLTDGEGRGTGRLVLSLRPMPLPHYDGAMAKVLDG